MLRCRDTLCAYTLQTLQMIIKLEKQQLLATLQSALSDLLAPRQQAGGPGAAEAAAAAAAAAEAATLDLGIASPRVDTGAGNTPRSAHHTPRLEVSARAASFAVGSSDHTAMMAKLAALRAKHRQAQAQGGEEAADWHIGALPSRDQQQGDPYLAGLQRWAGEAAAPAAAATGCCCCCCCCCCCSCCSLLTQQPLLPTGTWIWGMGSSTPRRRAIAARG